jgi:small multidrug resistance pump
VVLAATGSAILFDEVLTALKITGFVLISAGVAVVEIGSQRARRAAGPSAAGDVAPIHGRVPTAELPVLSEQEIAAAGGTEER